MTHPHLTEWRESRLQGMTTTLHLAWLPDQAAQATTRRIDMPTLTLIAPELRHISDPAPARYPHLSFAEGVPVAADCVEVAA